MDVTLQKRNLFIFRIEVDFKTFALRTNASSSRAGCATSTTTDKLMMCASQYQALVEKRDVNAENDDLTDNMWQSASDQLG